MLPDGAEIVAQVQFAGRLHAAEDAPRRGGRGHENVSQKIVGLVQSTRYEERRKIRGSCFLLVRCTLYLFAAREGGGMARVQDLVIEAFSRR